MRKNEGNAMGHDDHANDAARYRHAANDTEAGAPYGVDAPAAATGRPDDPFPSLMPVGVDADALADMQTYSSLQEKRKKAKRKKAITIAVSCIVALALIAGGTMWLIGSMTADPASDMPVQTTVVEKGLFLDEVSASGKLKPVSSVIATPEVDGLVGEVWVSEGDAVTQGQVLYTVVNADLDKAISQAQQGIDEANSGIAQAQIVVDDAYRAKRQGIEAAQAAAAAAEAAAASGAVEGGGATASGSGESFDVGQADSAIRQAELSLSNAWNALAVAQANYDDAVARAAKRSVISPINGSVVAVNIEPGKALTGTGGTSAAAPVQIADLSQMLVSVEVNEVDILKIKVDQPAKLTFSAIPDLALVGTVTRIATVNTGSGADMTMGSGAVTYAVDILIQSPDSRLKPGMTAKASVEAQKLEDVLMVPISAVTSLSATEGSVLVVNPDNPEDVQEHTVEILASNGLIMAVKGSLSAGDEVLIAGGAGASADDSAASSSMSTTVVVG